jgi:hypothetical protein
VAVPVDDGMALAASDQTLVDRRGDQERDGEGQRSADLTLVRGDLRADADAIRLSRRP